MDQFVIFSLVRILFDLVLVFLFWQALKRGEKAFKFLAVSSIADTMPSILVIGIKLNYGIYKNNLVLELIWWLSIFIYFLALVAGILTFDK